MNKAFLLVCCTLALSGCKKMKIDILSGTYEGTMTETTRSYNVQGISDTTYPKVVVVSRVGEDSIKIDHTIFLYSNDKKYHAGGVGQIFDAEFKGRKLYLKFTYGGWGGSTTYVFEGKR